MYWFYILLFYGTLRWRFSAEIYRRVHVYGWFVINCVKFLVYANDYGHSKGKNSIKHLTHLHKCIRQDYSLI
jgi:hypothetical protein